MLLQKPTTKGGFPVDFAQVLETVRLCPTELPPHGDTSDSGSDEDFESAKTEGGDDRRKTLLDSVLAGDSPLDQLKKQGKLEDYGRFFYLPGSRGEGEPMAVTNPQ